MDRRRHLAGWLGMGLAAATRARAQPQRQHRLGILALRPPPSVQTLKPPLDLFRSELGRYGFVEGQNLLIDRHWVDAGVTRFDVAAAELVALSPDVILTDAGTPAALAAQRATRNIPIVFSPVTDPVASGLVASLSRPGGNLTGFAIFTRTLDAKRAALLVEALGKPALLAVLDTRRTEAHRQRAMAEWPTFPGTRVQVFDFGSMEELPATFKSIAQVKPSGLVIMHTPFTAANPDFIAELAARYRLPAIADGRRYAESGLMLSYTTDFTEAYVRAADYVARILRGTATPAELPVEHLSRFLFVVNQRTAREFGVRIPQSLLLSATDVIE